MELNYRRDIDGLRAIAVLLVVLNHVGFTAFGGGYIGVDVFFVISGYLITRKTAPDIAQGRFSFADFYLRRVRRLLPAFIAMALVTSLVAACVLLPRDLAGYSKSLLAALLSVANVFFWRASNGYFSPTADELPLLHTWSLAVEEQYYLFWPVLLLLGYRLLGVRRWGQLAVLLALGGLALSEWAARAQPNAAYYLLHARAFELLVGSLLALHWERLPRPSVGQSGFLGLAGLALILVPAFSLDHHSRFPGLNALWPCLGAALLIWTGESRQGPARWLLAQRPLVFIGLISYSLYLWHWPLMAFANYMEVPKDLALRLGLVAVSLLLGALSWRFVEQPFRGRPRHSPPLIFAGLYMAPLLVGALAVGLTLKFQGFPQRYDADTAAMVEALDSSFVKARGSCFIEEFGNVATQWSPDRCRLGAVDRPRADVLVVGDSHAAASTGMLDVLLKDAGLRGYDMTRSGTLYLPGLDGVHITRPGNRLDLSIPLTAPVVTQAIRTGGYRYVVLGGRWPMYLEGMNEAGLSAYNVLQRQGDGATPAELLREGLDNALRIITQSGATPVILAGIPEIGAGRDTCQVKNRLFHTANDCSVELDDVMRRQEPFTLILDDLRQRYPQLLTLDPKAITCDARRCHSTLEGTPLYQDGNHLNVSGSRLIGERLVEQGDNPLEAEGASAKLDAQAVRQAASGSGTKGRLPLIGDSSEALDKPSG
jgi:peptidoglycan/LPS O-acetylase OafA/YrhL